MFRRMPTGFGQRALHWHDASLILGYHVPAPFRDKLDIQCKIADVEKMFEDEKMGKLKIVSQSKDVLVVEIEMV